MNTKDCLADLLTTIYLFDIPKIKENLEATWDEYQKLLDDAEKTRDLYTITKARAYLYCLGYFIIEDFGRGAIERRLNNFEPKIKFDDFVQWVDTEKIPSWRQKDNLFQKIVQFYKLLKEYKNKRVDGSYLDEDRFNKIYAEIQGKTVTDVYIWGQRKRQAKEAFKKEKVDRELKGVVASEGVARGKAFVIYKEEDIKDFPQGYILVASMTTPKFLPAMQKSIGIVTDFGGIMSHPAIIARELKLPCIVGTKYASLKIKTEDLIEVDTNNGTVRRVN